MFGLEKKKQKRGKASGSVKKKKTSKVKNVTPIKSKEKKGTLKVGEKYFDSPDEVSAFYRLQGERVKKALKRFKLKQAESYLGVAKGNLMKILAQKKKLGKIAQDLEEHKAVLNEKIGDIESQKEKGEIHKRNVKRFVNKMKSLEEETKKLLNIKEQVIFKEAELIKEMKDMVKVAQKDLDLTDATTAHELAKFEESKEAVLIRAKELLPEEMDKLFADNSLLEKLDEKAVKRLRELNINLAKIHGAKRETLKKRHTLEISEKETSRKLARAEADKKKLEEKYQDLLKK